MTRNFKSNDTSPEFERTLPISLDGASVKFRLQYEDEGLTVNEEAEIVDSEAGTVRYEWSSGDFGDPGTYKGEFRVTKSDGGIKHFPRSGFYEFNVRRSLGEVDPMEWEDGDVSVSVVNADEVHTTTLTTESLDRGHGDLINEGLSWASGSHFPVEEPSSTSSSSYEEVAELHGAVSADGPPGATLYVRSSVNIDGITDGEEGDVRFVIYGISDNDQEGKIVDEIELTGLTDDDNTDTSGWVELTTFDPDEWNVLWGARMEARVTDGNFVFRRRGNGIAFDWRVD